MTAKTQLPPPELDLPIYWFAVLDRAVAAGDHQAAAEAQRQLARLGVRVSYGVKRPETTEETAHA